MEKLRNYKIYKKLKTIFFFIVFCVYRIMGVKNRVYYLSKWIGNNKDDLLVRYPINSKSTVIDVGGYTGSFSDRIASLYSPSLIILEPVKKYFKILKRKYKDNENVVVYNHGLSNKSSQYDIYLSGDGTSLIKKSDKTEKIKLVNAASFIKNYKHIDLLSINIEGAEYEVVERLIETNMINKIEYLQIQFHSFAPNSKNRRKNIIKGILKTHSIYFSYPFVWESFKLKV